MSQTISPAAPAAPALRETAPADTPRAGVRTFGALPGVSLLVACGLCVVSLGDAASRDGVPRAEAIFWIGLVLLVAPVAYRLSQSSVSRSESLGLVVVLGGALYLVKVIQSPTEFTFHDEFLHWRTAYDIAAGHHLFSHNPLLPVSPLYPVLEIVTTALSSVTGLSIFASGLVVIGVARILLALALYLFFWEIGNSVLLAGMACVIYMADPNFVFFTAQFAYESLSLPLAVFVLMLLVRRERIFDSSRTRLTVVLLLALFVLVATHHLTSYILTGFLLFWTAVHLVERRMRIAVRWQGPGVSAILALGLSVMWLLTIANITIGYLAPHVDSTLGEVFGIVSQGASTTRHLFQSPSGYVAPLWERAASILTALLLTIGLPFGLLFIWRRYRRREIAVVLGLVSLLYPATLALRFTSSGWEIANRSSEFIFVPLGFTIAGAILSVSETGLRSRLRPLVFALFASLIFIGGIISGWPRSWLMPGPYRSAAGPQSVEPEGIADAYWARWALGPGGHVAGDRTNDLFMGSYGEQNPESTLNGGVDTSWIFLSPQIGPDQKALITKGKIQYVLTDLRLTKGRPLEQQFEGGDPRRQLYYTRPIAPRLLTKFDNLTGVSRFFDSGDIHLYDIGRYDHAPPLP